MGTPIARFCLSHPNVIRSTGNSMSMTIPLNVISEVQGVFSTMDSDCYASYNSLQGKFSTPRYPQSYLVNSECAWIVEASAGNTMVLTIESMDIENSENCNKDFLEIRADHYFGPLLGVFCGSHIPAAISGHNIYYIRFKSDDDVQGEGVLISYNHGKY